MQIRSWNGEMESLLFLWNVCDERMIEPVFRRLKSIFYGWIETIFLLFQMQHWRISCAHSSLLRNNDEHGRRRVKEAAIARPQMKIVNYFGILFFKEIKLSNHNNYCWLPSRVDIDIPIFPMEDRDRGDLREWIMRRIIPIDWLIYHTDRRWMSNENIDSYWNWFPFLFQLFPWPIKGITLEWMPWRTVECNTIDLNWTLIYGLW